MKAKRVIALLLAVFLMCISAFPAIAASNNSNKYKKNRWKSFTNNLASFATAGTPSSNSTAKMTFKDKNGKDVDVNSYNSRARNRETTEYHNKGAVLSRNGNKKVRDPDTGKIMTVNEANKKGITKRIVGDDPNAEAAADEQMQEDSEDDSLGMCGDAFASFTKAVNKFYATVKNLIEKVLPNPTAYIPNAWGWAEEFAQAFGAIGLSLCFIFWGIGYLKSNARFLRDRNFSTVMLPFVRAGVAAALSASAFKLVHQILQGGLYLVSQIAKKQLPDAGKSEMSLEKMQQVANDIGSLGLKKLLLWVEIMLATVGIKIMMFVIVGFVVVKFFKMFVYAALAPLPIASLAGENTQQHAFSYIKAILGVILECLVIAMTLELFLHGIFNGNGEPVQRLIPEISGETDNGEILMGYIENVLAWMFATTAIVFGSDRLVSKAFGN